MGALSFPIEFMSNSGGVTEAAIAAIDAWDSTAITASTHTAEAGEARVFTHATGCDVTLPTGAANGTIIAVRTGHATGYVKFVTGGGSSKVQSGTTQIAGGIGKVMVAQATATANEWNITGYDAVAPAFLGYFADAPAMMTAYPVGGAEIAALNLGDYLICTGGGPEKGLMFTPNAAKTRMIAVGRRITLAQLGGIVGTPIGTVGTGVTSGQFSSATSPLPAYLAQAGDFIEIWAVARKIGTNASTMKVRIGTTGVAASDQGVGELGFSTTTNDDGSIHTKLEIISNTSAGAAQRVTHNTRFNGSTFNNPNGGTLNFAAAQAITCDMETINFADSQQLLQFLVVLVQKP